ncbi:MAG: aminoglycoside phosphotransferase family protein [Paracoccaceae bacterium]
MTSRTSQMHHFLAQSGCDLTTVKMVAGDASHRKYFRVAHNGRSTILMDSDPSKGDTISPFLKVAAILRAAGLTPPEIYQQDIPQGFLLLEDLGDGLLARILKRDPSQEVALYEAATDVLVHLHQAKTPDLDTYNSHRSAPLAMLAWEWYAPQFFKLDTSANMTGYHFLQKLLDPLDADLSVLIHRDYHAENLLWLPERSSLKKVGLLDFQDAMLGHPAYDLVSILQDARRDVTTGTQTQMLTRFIKASSSDPAKFTEAYHILGLQRNLRILGGFARLRIRDAKTSYVDLIPRVWAYILTNLEALERSDLTKFITGTLPMPTPERLASLKVLSK